MLLCKSVREERGSLLALGPQTSHFAALSHGILACEGRILKRILFAFFIVCCASGSFLSPGGCLLVAGFSDVFFGSVGLGCGMGKKEESAVTTPSPICIKPELPCICVELHEDVCKTSLETVVGFLVSSVVWFGALRGLEPRTSYLAHSDLSSLAAYSQPPKRADSRGIIAPSDRY